MKQWKLRIIHVTHTDIGYKDVQEKIMMQQMSYFDDIINKFEEGDKKIIDNWVWTVEAFGVFEEYFKHASDEKREKILKLINDNKIGVTGNFFNFSEALSRDLIGALSKRVSAFAKNHDIKIGSAITNDINGYSQSYAEELTNNGVNNLFFGLHEHHGKYPANKKQWPFWWALPNGNKILTWIGEQYAFGNNLGFVKGPLSDYIVKDGKTAGWDEEQQIALSTERIIKHVKRLEDDKYPLDMVPITLLGTGSDNDPPNFEIIERIELFREIWKEHGIVDIKMCTLDEFFEEAREQITDENIPTYSGEMPDWWSNGHGTSPVNVRAFRQAQRNYRALNRISNMRNLNPDTVSLENNLALFAEHTFGGEMAITEVHGLYHFEIEQLKGLYPRNALKESIKLLDKASNFKIYKLYDSNSYNLRVTNIHNIAGKTTIDVARKFGLSEFARMTESDLEIHNQNGELVTYRFVYHEHPGNPLWGHHDLFLDIDFKDGQEEQFLTIKLLPKSSVVKVDNPITFENNIISSKNFSIKLNENGIEQITSMGEDIIKNIKPTEQLFSPMYEVEKADYKNKAQLFMQRKRMGLNQRGIESVQFTGELESVDVKILDDANSAVLKMYYNIEATSFYEVSISIDNNVPYLTTEINMIKNPEWSMENFFINIPLSGKLLIDKENIYEAIEDQIPGSLIDFHAFQDGFIGGNTFVVSLDQSLLWIGPAKFEDRQLAGNSYWKSGDFTYRSWPLNNNWETNFSPDTSGFHQFRYKIELSKEQNKKEKLSFMSIPPVVERVDENNKII